MARAITWSLWHCCQLLKPDIVASGPFKKPQSLVSALLTHVRRTRYSAGRKPKSRNWLSYRSIIIDKFLIWKLEGIDLYAFITYIQYSNSLCKNTATTSNCIPCMQLLSSKDLTTTLWSSTRLAQRPRGIAAATLLAAFVVGDFT